MMMKPSIDNDNLKKCATQGTLKHSLKNAKLNDNKCADCKKVFKFHFDFVRHAKQHHPNGKAFKCNECGARFSNTQALSSHRRVVNNVKQSHVCKFCSKSFIWESNLKRHLSVHNKERPYPCPFCTKTFKDKRDSNKHQQKCSKNKYSCTFCEKTYKHDRGLRKHLVLHTGENPYFCTVCEKSFKRKDILKKHQEIHLKYKTNNACSKDSVEKPYICKFCSKTFDFESLLKYHMRVHTGERPYSCSVCNRTYIRQKDLNKHERKGHKQNSNAKDLTCKYCSKTFDRNFRLENHLKLHADDSAFSCSVCGDVFKKKYNLKNHLNNHLEKDSKVGGVKNSKISLDKQNLNNYEKTNMRQEHKERGKDVKKSKKDTNSSQLKPALNDKADTEIVCEFCSKTFKRSLQLKIHLKEHTKKEDNSNVHQKTNAEQKSNSNRDFNELKTKNVCEYCSKTFKRLSHLEIHLRLHTEERPFSCCICEKTFKDKSTLNKHQEMHPKQKLQECCTDLKIWKQNKAKEKSTKTKVINRSPSNDITNTNLPDNSQEKSIKPIEQETTNLENILDIPANAISLDSDDLEFENYMESSHINNSPIENKHSSTSLNLCTNNTQPTKHMLKKYNIAERQPKVVFKPQLYRGLNRCFKVQDTSEQRNYPCFLCEKSYTESRLLKEHQKIHLKQKIEKSYKSYKDSTNC